MHSTGLVSEVSWFGHLERMMSEFLRFKRRIEKQSPSVTKECSGKHLIFQGSMPIIPLILLLVGLLANALQMLSETINKSVGSSLKVAGRRAGLKPGDMINEIIWE